VNSDLVYAAKVIMHAIEREDRGYALSYSVNFIIDMLGGDPEMVCRYPEILNLYLIALLIRKYGEDHD